jgi:cytochrome c peroxidase
MRRILLVIIPLVLFSCKKNTSDLPATTHLNIEIPDYKKTSINCDMPIPENNPLTEEGIALGRMLFFEKQLSGDNTMACATCHLQENKKATSKCV